MQTEICKITFLDGSWVKAEVPVGADLIDYVLDNFGMFASIEGLEDDDAAAVAYKAKKSDVKPYTNDCMSDSARRLDDAATWLQLNRQVGDKSNEARWELVARIWSNAIIQGLYNPAH